ncbi:SET and MYND domain containing, class 3 isoform X2 [Rhodnius prolixus]|uniref:MYND-type domain-containing protein n=1 Tax=Rhodnius prolixus TaxID=13249 RepID=T1HI49_RHOPR
MIKCGTSIHMEKPFVHVLSSHLRNQKCDHCYAERELLSCSGCRYVKYCDKSCQKSAWSYHKNECINLRKLPSGKEVPNTARLLLRLITKLKKGGEQEKGNYDKNKFRFFKDLQSHYSQIKEDNKRMEHAVSLYGVLKGFMEENNLPNFSEFTGIYGRVVVNSFNILDGDMNNLGTGIYLGASTIDHSCEPNAVAVFSGTSITIRTIKDIPEFKWSKVRICYIDSLKSTEERRSALLEQYYFLCDCPRCNSLTKHNVLEASVECQKCFSSISYHKGESKCPSCSWEVPVDFSKVYFEVVNFTNEQHERMNTIAYLDACKVCLSKQKDILHKNSLLYVKTMDLAFEASLQLNKWDDALSLGDQLSDGYRIYYGNTHPVLGLHYMKLGKILLLKNEFEKALETLEKAETIIKITHGTEHEFYRTQLYRLLFEAKSAAYGL